MNKKQIRLVRDLANLGISMSEKEITAEQYDAVHALEALAQGPVQKQTESEVAKTEWAIRRKLQNGTYAIVPMDSEDEARDAIKLLRRMLVAEVGTAQLMQRTTTEWTEVEE